MERCCTAARPRELCSAHKQDDRLLLAPSRRAATNLRQRWCSGGLAFVWMDVCQASYENGELPRPRSRIGKAQQSQHLWLCEDLHGDDGAFLVE